MQSINYTVNREMHLLTELENCGLTWNKEEKNIRQYKIIENF